ncbi:Transcription factor DIVARICATA [Platanthera zijinensis]|uniref:Transcription factor DIVARICATA n=1 Tax=Platanthera zijinensis TaxID=2320716 RepID=A0AAP0GAK2_9ASPA
MPSTAGDRAGREGGAEEMRWCIAEDAAFEDALATIPYPLNEDASGGASEDEDRWLEALASRVPGKTAAQVKMHYEILVADVKAIEDGMVLTPPHWDDQLSSSPRTGGSEAGGQVNRVSVPEQDRRKGMPWTEQEHSSFLLGLKRYGKGDWRSISRFCVVSRTPTQVASHAQKFFIRQNSMNNGRRRSSIHDVKSVCGPAIVNSVIGSSANHHIEPNMHATVILRAPTTHPDCYDRYFPECYSPYQEPNVGTMPHPNVFPCAHSGHPSSMH